jgi:integrase
MSAGQARQGQVFKRCRRCNAHVPERRCPKCGARDSFTWAFVVDITPKDEQGHLIGKRQQKKAQGFTTRAAAQDALNQLQVEKKAGTYIDPSRMTFGEYLDQWLADADAHGWEGSTKTGYDVVIRNHLKPYAIASTRLQALTSMQFRAHYSWLTKHGKIRRSKEGEITYQGPLSRKSVQNVHIVVRAALNDAVAAEPPLLRKNVAIGCFTYSRRKDRPEMLTWAVEEMHAFLAFTAQEPDHTLYRLNLMTGMRRGEVLGLRHRDLLLDRVIQGVAAPALNVRQQWARDGAAGLIFKGLKNDSTAWRTIDLDQDTAAVLRAHLDVQEFQRRSWGAVYASKCPRCGKQVDGACARCGLKAAELDLVFCHPDGSPFDPDVVGRRFERRTEDCPGVLAIGFHDMRHTHATLLLENGETERYVAERLGDTVEMIHQTYGHVTPKMRAGAVRRLAALLSAPATSLAGHDQTHPDAEGGGHSNGR